MVCIQVPNKTCQEKVKTNSGIIAGAAYGITVYMD